MKIWINNVKNELQKMFYYRKTWLFLILTVLIPLLLALVLAYTESANQISMITSSNFSISILWVYTTIVFPFLIFMIAADLFTEEVADGTIKLVLTRPI